MSVSALPVSPCWSHGWNSGILANQCCHVASVKYPQDKLGSGLSSYEPTALGENTNVCSSGFLLVLFKIMELELLDVVGAEYA